LVARGGGWRGAYRDSSKTDLSLAKAKPVSDGGSASGIMYLRRGEKYVVKMAVKTGVRICKRNNSAVEEGEEVLQAPEQRFPCTLWRRPW